MFIATHRRSFRSLPWVAFRCLLLAAAWQGPLPWCHSHGVVTAESESWLRAHVSVYHPGETLDAASPLGMHFHVEFPQGGGDDNAPSPVVLTCQNSSPRADHEAESLCLLGDDLSEGDKCVWAFGDLKASSIARFAAGRSPQGFFESFASDLALPLRLGIMRC
jgi:hypothetical protein